MPKLWTVIIFIVVLSFFTLRGIGHPWSLKQEKNNTHAPVLTQSRESECLELESGHVWKKTQGFWSIVSSMEHIYDVFSGGKMWRWARLAMPFRNCIAQDTELELPSPIPVNTKASVVQKSLAISCWTRLGVWVEQVLEGRMFACVFPSGSYWKTTAFFSVWFVLKMNSWTKRSHLVSMVMKGRIKRQKCVFPPEWIHLLLFLCYLHFRRLAWEYLCPALEMRWTFPDSCGFLESQLPAIEYYASAIFVAHKTLDCMYMLLISFSDF